MSVQPLDEKLRARFVHELMGIWDEAFRMAIEMEDAGLALEMQIARRVLEVTYHVNDVGDGLLGPRELRVRDQSRHRD
jgi:hypothetical protein